MTTMTVTSSLKDSSTTSILSGSTLGPSTQECRHEYVLTSPCSGSTKLYITQCSPSDPVAPSEPTYSIHISVHSPSPRSTPPQVTLHQGSDLRNPVVAGARVFSTGKVSRVILGDAAAAQKAGEPFWYRNVVGTSLGSAYTLQLPGHDRHDGQGAPDKEVSWKRTHDKEFGASRMSQSDYKLVDTATGDLLAVFVSKRSGKEVGRLRTYVDLTPDQELVMLVSSLLIQGSIRRQATKGLGTYSGASPMVTGSLMGVGMVGFGGGGGGGGC